MGTGQNRPTVNLPLADLPNRLAQPIDKPRQGKTCNSGTPTKPACVSRRGIPKFARQAVSGSVQAPPRSAVASGDGNAKFGPDCIVATNFKNFNEGEMQRNIVGCVGLNLDGAIPVWPYLTDS
jgi:hypothetical protein